MPLRWASARLRRLMMSGCDVCVFICPYPMLEGRIPESRTCRSPSARFAVRLRPGVCLACAERVLSVCWACAGHVLGVFAACGWSTARMRAARRLSSTATPAPSVKRGTVCRMAAFVGSAGGWQRQALVHGSLLEGVSARANDRLWSFCQSLHIIIENYAD